jgi:hypothetical protein
VPIKKRISKAKTLYPETIERLIAWQPIAQTEDAQSELVCVVYFNEYPELPDVLRARAMDILSSWRLDKCQ